MQKSLGGVIAASLLVLIICTSVIFPAFFMPFYRWQFARPREYSPFNGRSAVQTIDATMDDLLYAMGELLEYMRGRRDTLDGIQIVVDGELREFYSDLEKRHMIDVRVLMMRVLTLRTICLVLIFLAVVISAHLKIGLRQTLAFAAGYARMSIILILGLALILAAVISIDFSRSWDIFHHIFFNNDYWILTHRRDLLLDMVSLSFFLHMSIFVGFLIIAKGIVVVVASTVYLRRMAIDTTSGSDARFGNWLRQLPNPWRNKGK